MLFNKPTPKLLVVMIAIVLAAVCNSGFASPVGEETNQIFNPLGGRGKLNARPANLKFHAVPIGQSAILPAVLTNIGSASLIVSKMTNNAPGYTLSGITLPLTLGAGKSVNFEVKFTPFQNGQTNGNFAFISNGANSPYYVYVYGKGAPGGVISANPASIDFGAVQVGKNSTKYETLTNTGTATATITQANVTGSGFSIQGLDLPLVLAAGQQFTFTASFAPLVSGAVNGSIALVSDAFNPNLQIPLAGTGTPAGTLATTPASLDFGVIVVGNSKTLPATLTATGASVTVSSAQTSSAEFTINGLTIPFTIPSGQNQPYTVTYTPQNNGPASGTATLVSDAANSPTTQALTGIGGAPPHHTVDLSWNASPSGGVVGYNIYRGGAKGGPYDRINAVVEPGTAYRDDAVSPGNSYYYVATAVDGTGAESAKSNEAQAVIPNP